MPPASGSQSIDRAAQLLVAVADSVDPIGVGELAEATDLPKSTASRLVSALVLLALHEPPGWLAAAARRIRDVADERGVVQRERRAVGGNDSRRHL